MLPSLIKRSMQPLISTRHVRVRRTLCLMVGLLIACAEPSFATPPASTGELGLGNVILSLSFVVMMMGSLGGKRTGLWSPPTRPTKSCKRSSPTLDRIGTQLLSADFLDTYFSLLGEVESLLAFTPSFERPAPKPPKRKDARPSRFIVQPDQRMVSETQDRTKHFLAALKLESPEIDWHSKYELPQACKKRNCSDDRKTANITTLAKKTDPSSSKHFQASSSAHTPTQRPAFGICVCHSPRDSCP